MADTSTPDVVELDAAKMLELRAQAADIVAAEPTRIDRPDGVPGLAEALEQVELLPPQVAQARDRLNKAREGGDQVEIRAAQQELADAAGLTLRTVPAPPRSDDSTVRELVATDLLNLGPRGQRRQLIDGDLTEAYEDLLRTAIALRGVLERRRTAFGDAAGVPAPPEIRDGMVIARQEDDGSQTAWQRREGRWWPLLNADDFAGIPEADRAAIEEHFGPLPR